MYHSNYYKYEKDGIVYVSGDLPEGATLLEAMDILNADEGKVLIRKADNENVGTSIWLQGEDNESNYIEGFDEQVLS